MLVVVDIAVLSVVIVCLACCYVYYAFVFIACYYLSCLLASPPGTVRFRKEGC